MGVDAVHLAKSYNSTHSLYKIFNALMINFIYAIVVMSEYLKIRQRQKEKAKTKERF